MAAPSLTKTTHPGYDWIVSWNAQGQRRVRYFRDRAAAAKVLAEWRRQYDAQGTSALVYDRRMMHDAKAAMEILRNSGMSLTEAARAAVKSGVVVKSSPHLKLAALLEEFVGLKKEAGRSPATIADIKQRIGRFMAISGAVLVRDLTRQACTAFVHQKGVAGQTRLNNKRVLSGWFNWMRKVGYLADDPLSGLDDIKVGVRMPAVMSLAAADEAVRVARDYDARVLRKVVLCMLAGLRPSEADQLRNSAVQGDRLAVVGVGKLRDRTSRLVPLSPRFKAVWAEVADCEEPATKMIWQLFIRRLSFKWKQDMMRHTWISYRLALTGDLARTALEAGNSPRVVTRHYHDARTEADARKFFGMK